MVLKSGQQSIPLNLCMTFTMFIDVFFFRVVLAQF